jgi:Ca2+-binding EF-hand superfamily protein
MFQAYDTDGNGVLSPTEVYDLFKATAMTKGQFLKHEELVKMVNDCFREVDENKDGSISLEEFKKAVLSQKLVLDCFINLTY